MVRQQSSLPFNERESATRTVKVKYHIIFEGRTEMDYFDRLKDSRLLKDNVYIFKILKKGIERDMSDRMEMIESATDYMLFNHTGRSTLRRYITTVLNDFFNQEKNVVNKTYKEFCKELLALRSDLINTYNNYESIHDGLVDEETDLHRRISEYLSDLYGLKYKMGDTDSFTCTKRPKDDSQKVMVIFDRDYSTDYFDHEKYKKCIHKCEEEGYTPIVSSPKFELWMLMHMKDANFGKPSFYPSYGRYVSNELVRCGDVSAIPGSEDEKFISQERFDKHYIGGIMLAIERSNDSTLFQITPKDLMDHAGTNVGNFIKAIISESKLPSSQSILGTPPNAPSSRYRRSSLLSKGMPESDAR